MSLHITALLSACGQTNPTEVKPAGEQKAFKDFLEKLLESGY